MQNNEGYPMNTVSDTDLQTAAPVNTPARKFDYPGQVVLVLQGGGALGAYQVGVYQALHEAGVEPHWVIGTSIGAINAAIIAGNEPNKRPNHQSACPAPCPRSA